MRNPILAILAALAVLMVAVPAASALPPSFPSADGEADNWSTTNAVRYSPSGNHQLCDVDNRSCEFSSGALWEVGGTRDLGTDCWAILTGNLGHDGRVKMTNPYVWGCPVEADASSLPWTGQICKHEPTNAYWLRQTLRMRWNTSSPYRTSVTFGKIYGFHAYAPTSVPAISAYGIRFGNTEANTEAAAVEEELMYGWYNVWAFHRGFFEEAWGTVYEGDEVLIGAVEEGCDWPELS